MAESIPERVVEAIRTRLAGISEDNGANYWFTPDRVLRAPAFTQDCLDTSQKTIYTLIPEVEETVEEASLLLHVDLGIDLVLVTRFSQASESPLNPPDPDRWKLQNRLAQDVKKRLAPVAGSFSWIGVPQIENLEVVNIDRSPENTYLQGWAMVIFHVVARYAHGADES